ncbi:MAG: comEC 2 [Firmicutes bacterium]|nr:comEC 2 [Bacillota bacterium]
MKLNHVVLLVCIVFGAGIWLAELYSWNTTLLIGLAILLLLTLGWRVYSNYQRSFGSVMALFFVAGMLCYNQAVLIPANDISHYIGQNVTVLGSIADVPETTASDEISKRVRYTIKAEQVRTSGTDSARAVSGKIRLTIQYKDTEAKPISFGDKVAIYGKVLELHGYNNPGQIDMTAALKRQGISVRMTSQEQAIQVLAANNEYTWQMRLQNWRQTVIVGMQKVMPVNDAAILTAVLFGGYQGIDKKVINDFATTGLIHILSVSGAHIALVVGLITWLGKRLRWRTLSIVILSAIIVIFYAVMSGLTPPVIRSAIMGILSLLAVMFNRDTYAPAAFGTTGLVMLIYQPLLLFDISFQLSFGATAGLVFLYPKTLEYLSKRTSWAAGPLAVTLAAQLGVLPIIAWYFNNFSLVSFLANIIVLPIIELVIILGLLGVIIYIVFPLGGNIIFVVGSLLLGLAMSLTKLLASVPYGSMYVPAASMSVSVLYYLVLAWIYGWRPFQIPGFRECVSIWPRTSSVIAVVVIGLLTAYAWYPHPLSVHFIDVGQGDATLIITPHGRSILVDAGGSWGDSSFDVGERVVAPYLKHYGIRALDYLVLTHGHQDHAGGAAGVANIIKTSHVLLPQEEPSQAVQALLHTARQAMVIPVYTGLRFQIDNVSIDIEHGAGSQSSNSNEASSVIRVTYGRHSFLLTGDLESKGEAVLLVNNIAPCTVLKVGHHGARTSTTEPFLQAVAPEFAVISVGYGNSFGHPHQETLRRLAKQAATIYRTDRQGAVVFSSDGKHIDVQTYMK